MCTEKIQKECMNLGFGFTFEDPPAPPHPAPILTKNIKKFIFRNWRINTLALSRYVIPKFHEEEVKPKGPWSKPKIDLSNETEFFSRNLSRPPVRTLVCNRNLFGWFKGKNYIDRMDSFIGDSWKTTYNYVKYRLRHRMLKRMAKKKDKLKSKLKIDFKRIYRLAEARKRAKSAAKASKKKIFKNYRDLEVFAVPLPRNVTKIKDPNAPPKPNVRPDALKYEPTDRVRELAAIPKRWQNIPPPKKPGYVERGALHYKITERTETLSVPKRQRQKAAEDTNSGWTISPNALKYKPSQRILDLAKPRERD